jgi:hypothetical protein
MSTENSEATVSDAQTQSSAAPPRRRGWWSRNWLWFVPTLLLTILILSCGTLGIIYWFVVGPLHSEPYPTAMQLVQKDPRVTARLGAPIRDVRWIPSGERTIEGDGGKAWLDFDVAGPKAQAHVHFQARRIAGKWGFSQLEVTFGDNKERINIATDAGEGAAPLYEQPKTEGKEPGKTAPPKDIELHVPSAE